VKLATARQARGESHLDRQFRGRNKADRPEVRDHSNAGVNFFHTERLWGTAMKSSIVKRSVVIAGHKTSVSLEDAFWKAFKEAAALRNVRLSDLVASVDLDRKHANLSSAIRLFVLESCRNQFGEKTARRDVTPQEGTMRPANSA
jgi:predicted DNA-binding ribbon-helix-helix protein